MGRYFVEGSCMSILAHRGFLLKPSGPVFVGQRVIDGVAGTQVLNYPTGTVSGDLIIVVTHNGGSSASGWTLAFTTPGDQNGYIKSVLYKISAGETSMSIAANTGFDSTVLAFRGLTSVNASYIYSYATGGNVTNISAPAYIGHSVLIASDRGASAGYPSVGATGRTHTWTGSATYFRQTGGVYMNHANGLAMNFTDYGDVYGTSGLRFRVQ